MNEIDADLSTERYTYKSNFVRNVTKFIDDFYMATFQKFFDFVENASASNTRKMLSKLEKSL